jgi:hypothetical protein
VFGDDIRILS